MADKTPIDYVGGPVGAVSSHGEAGVGEVLKPAASPNKAELRRLTIQRDMMGTIHIKSGDFDYVQIRYQYPYTDNASTQRLAEQVVAILDGRSEVENLRTERDAALAELEACRKDAERYRHLLENAVGSYSGEQVPVLVCRFDLPVDGWREEVSRRIDAAASLEAIHA